MTFVRLLLACSFTLVLASALVVAQPKPDPHDATIKRAIGYLSKEVPRWHAEHPCYSCHNNGDATRALITAGLRGYDIGTSVDTTVDFLRLPAQWDQNKAPGGFD